MELKPGYKQTEVGVIPEDWQVSKIRDLCTLINGRGFKPFEWKTAGLPIIRIQNLNGSQEFNYYSGIYDKKIVVMPGQLLFAWSGSRGTSFGPHIWSGSVGLLNYHTWKMQVNESEVIPRFFYFALKKLTKNIEDNAHGASALVHTQKWEMEGLELGIPSGNSEQQAIAEALSNTEALIESLEQLLAKKRQIKQGAMQELLTGKRRLPGFEGEWRTFTLESIGEFFKGRSITRDQAQTGHLPCVRYGEIYTTHNDYIRVFSSWISSEVSSTATELRQGDILFAGSGETKEEIGKCVAFLDDLPAYAGGDIVILRPRGFDPLFLGYALNTKEVVNQKASKGQGDAVVHISAAALGQVKVRAPQFTEQSAIASILFEMDAEISALEARLEKSRQLKQGMMQELLTGRIRLVKPNTATASPLK